MSTNQLNVESKYKQCTPETLLPVGTKVTVKDKKGIVVSATWAKDQFGDHVCLHTAKLTHRLLNKYIGKGKMGSVWEQLKSKETQPCNYSFIYYESTN